MEEKSVILVVDDEAKINEALSAYFQSKQHTVYTAETGYDALNLFHRNRIDIIVLDLMLPDISGEEICTEIRKTSSVPIIMLTAKAQEENILRGLNAGADDYVTKPFSIKQLYARMQAVLRRTQPQERAMRFNGGDLIVDLAGAEVKKEGRTVKLTASEFNLLAALLKRPNVVFTREMLIDAAFGNDFDGYDRVIDTHVKNLRKKIETDGKEPRYILTVRGKGYKFGGQRES